VAENVKLGAISVPVPAKRAGEVIVECRFSYDASGLLEVDVAVPESGLARQLVIADDEERADAKAFARRRDELAKLKLHPREEASNAALLARAKRCYEDHIGEKRAFVGELLSRLDTELNSQDPRRVAAVREEVTQALDALEGERFL
jgi:molecular chaperone HscC